MLKRFTLVELLVILAIIAILLTFLLPSLSRAREVARAAVCMNNANQYGQLYIQLVMNKKDGRIYFGNDWRVQTARMAYTDQNVKESIVRSEIMNALKCPTNETETCGWARNTNITDNEHYAKIEKPAAFIAYGNREGSRYRKKLGTGSRNISLFESHLGRDSVWMFDGHSESVTWNEILDINNPPNLFDQ